MSCARYIAVLRFGVLLGALLLPAAGARAQLLSPGPLSRVHRALEGDQNCRRCHEGGKRVVAELCLSCHQDIAKSIAQKRGLHGTRFAGQNCGGSCHVDHHGRDTPQIRWPGGDRDRFDHAPTGFVLRGAHARADCLECHTRKTKSGTQSFLGLSRACKSCHQDPHAGRLGDGCESCHGEQSFAVADFDHAKTRFALRGRHALAACEGCHGKPHRFEGMRWGDCSACHKDPHPGKDWGPCKGCHVEEGFHLNELSSSGLAVMRKGHPGVALVRGHASVACESCHGGRALEPPPQGGACADCHEPVHDALFGRDCGECHRGVRWLGLPDELGYRVHGLTRFELDGAHQQVACDACHDPERPAPQRYRKLPHGQCLDCHRDPHAGQFAERDGGECSACHGTHGFSPARFGAPEHARTTFPLDGKHLATPCGACHGYGHPRVKFAQPAQACADCHDNPHGDLFQRELADGGCARCHDTAGWDRPRVDHSRWPLTGAHRDAHCDRCHAVQAEAGAIGDPRRYHDAPRECSGCHGDVHAGQFQQSDPQRTCDECHDTRRFAIETFAHEDKSGFALDGAHQRLECGACHRAEQLRNGTTAVRYRLGYSRCSDCHRDPHGASP